jgi:hypothetical protein
MRLAIVPVLLAACGSSSPPPEHAHTSPTPVVHVGEPTKIQAYDNRVIPSTIDRDERLQDCFGHIGEGVSVEVVVTFTIGLDGVPVDVSATGHPQFTDCVERAVRAMKFPAPQGGVVRVNYPIRLAR